MTFKIIWVKVKQNLTRKIKQGQSTVTKMQLSKIILYINVR